MNKFTILLIALFLFFSCNQTDKRVPKGKRQEFEGKDNTGILREYNKDGVLVKETQITNGTPDGFIKEYYGNGKLSIHRQCKMGISEGITTRYYFNGIKSKETSYERGKINGLVKRYYENGALFSEVPMKNGLPVPGYKEFDKNGKPIAPPKIIIDDKSDDLSIRLFVKLDKNIKAEYYILDYQNGKKSLIPLPMFGEQACFSYRKELGYAENITIHFIVQFTTRYQNYVAIEKIYTYKFDKYQLPVTENTKYTWFPRI